MRFLARQGLPLRVLVRGLADNKLFLVPIQTALLIILLIIFILPSPLRLNTSHSFGGGGGGGGGGGAYLTYSTVHVSP